jgi:hypothetical protein
MVTAAIVPGRAQTAKPVKEALTVNGDGAQRSGWKYKMITIF